jgi:hypothetical protein
VRIDFADLRNTYNELVSDVEDTKKLDTDFCSESFIKRTYTRSFFSMIEGVTFQLKRIALQANKKTNVFEAFEILLLEERTGHLASNGIAKDRNAKLQLLTNLQFAIRSVAKALNLKFEINKGSGWTALCAAVKVRDRITHPKTTESLLISDDDMQILGQANAWFRDEIARLIEMMHAYHDVV